MPAPKNPIKYQEWKEKIGKARIGIKNTEETNKKISESHKGMKKPWAGSYKRTEITKNRMSLSKSGNKNPMYGKRSPNWKGENCKKKQERNDSSYIHWVMMVKKRDNRICRINNKDCGGKLRIHHILGWSKFPELRYNINNGITLCQFHHPLKRIDEQRLTPFFQEMVRSKE